MRVRFAGQRCSCGSLGRASETWDSFSVLDDADNELLSVDKTSGKTSVVDLSLGSGGNRIASLLNELASLRQRVDALRTGPSELERT